MSLIHILLLILLFSFDGEVFAITDELIWVGLYKNNNTSLIIENCDKKSCTVHAEIEDHIPVHLRHQCEHTFNFKIGHNELSLRYQSALKQKKTARLHKLKNASLKFNGYEPFIKGQNNGLCSIDEGDYTAVYDKSKVSVIKDILPVCTRMMQSRWLDLCFNSNHYDQLRDLSIISAKTGDTLFDLLRSIERRSPTISWRSVIVDEIVQYIHPKSKKTKILKDGKFEGLYETQNLEFYDGNSAWQRSLSFENCQGRVCDAIYYHSQMNPEPATKAIFQSEDKIVLKECDKPLLLVKKENKWDIDDKNECDIGLQHVDLIPYKPHPIFEAGFNCLTEKLTPLERSICSSERLASLDQYLNTLFKKFEKDPHQIKEQLAWLKNRESCSKQWPYEYETCLLEHYNSRIYQLFKK